jgi:acetyl esterase/lipase
MPLDRHARRFLDMLSLGGSGSISSMTPSAMREAMLNLARSVDVKGVTVGEVEDRKVPGPAGPFVARIFTPAAVAGTESPGIVYFHGGAGIFNDLETHDGVCRMLANASASRVISIDYRLAPEHPFPAAVDDAFFAVQWVADHARELRVYPNKLVVAGDSVGGTLATVVCQLAKQAGGPTIALQLLLCPVTDWSGEYESRQIFGHGYFIDRNLIDWTRRYAWPPETDLRDVRVSPLRAPDLTGLPPAHIHTAEFDPFRDEGKAYADALGQSGVPVHYICHSGMIHHFYGMGGVIPYARTAIADVGAAIRASLE